MEPPVGGRRRATEVAARRKAEASEHLRAQGLGPPVHSPAPPTASGARQQALKDAPRPLAGGVAGAGRAPDSPMIGLQESGGGAHRLEEPRPRCPRVAVSARAPAARPPPTQWGVTDV